MAEIIIELFWLLIECGTSEKQKTGNYSDSPEARG
jgi:hypothetical protein